MLLMPQRLKLTICNTPRSKLFVNYSSPLILHPVYVYPFIIIASVTFWSIRPLISNSFHLVYTVLVHLFNWP